MKIDPHIKEELKKFLEHKIIEEKKRVTVLSAYPLSKEELDEITALFPNLKESILVNRVDSEIIAGIVITFGTKRIDLSLGTQLKNLHKSLHEIN